MEIDTQIERSNGWGFFILWMTLLVAITHATGITSTQNYIYETIAIDHCKNSTEYKYTGLQKDTDPIRFNCEKEVFQITKEPYAYWVMDLEMATYTVQ